MSERYTRLFSLPENLYAEGSPVIIAAGALLKDNQTGRVLAQLKLRSISEKDIQAVKVCLNLFDTALCPIGEPVMFDYLDLRALRDAEFGQKTPVMVPESKARSYTAAVTEVVFSDKSSWTADGVDWEPLPRQKTLEGVFQDAELVKQYKIAVGSNFAYYPTEEKDLWFCACGAVNRAGKPCHVCSRTLPELRAIDREQLIRDKDARLVEEARQAAEEKAAADAKRKKTAKILKIAIPAVCAVIAFVVLLNSVILPVMKEKAALKKLEQDYNAAVALMDAGQYEEAIVAFEAMEGYKDSAQKIEDCEIAILEEKYSAAVALMEEGKYDESIAAFESLGDYKDSSERILEAQYDAAATLADRGKTAEAAIAFGELGDYQDAKEQSLALWNEIAPKCTIAAGSSFIAGILNDGDVIISDGQNIDLGFYYQNMIQDDIVTISAGDNYIVGIRSDGTVPVYGCHNKYELKWSDIVAVSAGGFYSGLGSSDTYHIVGLKCDGTVAADGSNVYGKCNVSGWNNIIAVCAAEAHTVGLKADGTVLATGSNKDGQCNVSSWNNIVAICAGGYLYDGGHTIGLKSDGTVVATGDNTYGRCNVSDWTDIVAISAGKFHTVGLKSDGGVVAVGLNDGGRCNVSDWKDIIAISAGTHYTIGLKADGSIVVAGSYSKNVSTWENNKLP